VGGLGRRLCAALLMASLSSAAVAAEKVGAEFWKGPIATREARLSGYTMAQQWEIFRYANQRVHPPATGLANVLAHGGKPMADYVVAQAESSGRELDYRDALRILQAMRWSGTYDVCGDAALQTRLERQNVRFEKSGWHGVMLQLQRGPCRPG
jgi:hypothetical protein